MVHVTKHNHEEVYQCDACQLHYRVRGDADKCERWCNTHQSCNIELIAKSVDGAANSESQTK